MREKQERAIIRAIKKEYGIPARVTARFLYEHRRKEGSPLIPLSIFCPELSPFEAVVLFMKKRYSLTYAAIGNILERDQRVIGATYRRSKEKLKGALKIREGISIPCSIFTKDYSIFERLVAYLKDHLAMSYHEIGVRLQRDERTIWTVYHRYTKKHEKRKEKKQKN